MNTISVPSSVEVDEEGFLWRHSDWSEKIARVLARLDGLVLTPDHWEVINFVREYYKEQPIVLYHEYKFSTGDELAKAMAKEQAATSYPRRGVKKWLYTLSYLYKSWYERKAEEEALRTLSKKYSTSYLHELFPKDQAHQAARYAGLTLIKKHKRTLSVPGKAIQFDEEGFLLDRYDWSEEVARTMAKTDGFVLTAEHWEVINFMREYFEEYRYTPNTRMLPKAIGKKLGAEKGNNKYLYGLFPYGPSKQAGKYAGLPRPHGCP